MREVKLTESDIVWAWARTKDVGIINAHRPNALAVLLGSIGERIILNDLKGSQLKSTVEYDILYNKKRVEVKTQATSVTPLPEYEAVVNARSMKQSCDVYGFVRIKNDLTVAWILGYMGKHDFNAKAVYAPKGTKLKHRVQTWDKWYVQIQELEDEIK